MAYNGISARAYTSKMATAVSAYDKALKLIAAEHGTFTKGDPTLVSGAYTCLGNSSDYPATDMFPAGVCVVDTSNSANNISFNSAVTNKITEVISTMPEVPVQHQVRYGTSSWYYRGAYVFVMHDWFEVEIGLPSNVSCPSNMREYATGGIHWCELEGYIPSN